MRSLRRFVRRTLKFFASFQVELRGHYSASRLRDFGEYHRATLASRALFLWFILPVPSLLVLAIIDTAPLAPPSDSFRGNYVFWIRDLVIMALLTRSILEQISINVPGLHVTPVQRLVPSIAAALTATAYRMLCSSLIGFPLPFNILFGVPVWLAAVVICFLVYFGRILNQDRALRWELIKGIAVLNCQVFLTIVYPIYVYGFQAIGENAQLIYVMLLPVIKILAKNLLSATLGANYDLLPQIMIFNVDVLYALSVSSSVQTSNSIATTFAMIMLDAGQALISIWDINRIMRVIVLLRRKIPDNHTLKSASFVDIALQIFKEDGQAQGRLDSCRYDSAVAVLRRNVSSEGSFTVRTSDTMSGRGAVVVAPACQQMTLKEDCTDQTSLLMSVFSPNERKLFVHKSAQILFTTEFVILVEYAEVIVPLIYCISTASMFFLPNRAYYPLLKSLDEDELQQKISSVLRYAALELLSLLVIGYAIQRKLRISMLRLVSFVLDSGWRMVQASLLTWILFTVESSLEHSGNDYSLSFRWLKRNQ